MWLKPELKSHMRRYKRMKTTIRDDPYPNIPWVT